MIKPINIKNYLLLFLFCGAMSCNLDDGNTVPITNETLLDIIATNAELSTLASALQKAGLESTLEGANLYTLFAPSNNAFSTFLSSKGFASVDAVPTVTLRQILLNHVLPGRVEASTFTNLQKNYIQTSAEGPATGTNLVMYFDATNGLTLNGTINVTQADIVASNGLIHLTDAVIDLPTLKTFISFDSNFVDFDTALDLIAPLSDVPNKLSEDGPFTVFVPIEHAFDNLLDTKPEWNSISDIDETLLTAVIEHHVLEGNLRSTDLTAGQTLPTLEGDIIELYSLDGNLEITDGTGTDGSIIGVTDIQAANGVIHIIPNKVLLPDTTN